MAPGIASLALIAVLSVATVPNVAFAQAAQSASTLPKPIDIRTIHVRQQPGFIAGRLGERVVVEGVVSTPSVNFGEYAHLPIQDERGVGLLLERERGALGEFNPGDIVQA